MYATPAKGGLGDSKFWTTKSRYNMTEVEQKIKEYTTTVNTAFEYGAPYQLLIQKRWPGASIAVFDVHSLLTELMDHPAKYFTAPQNVTGYYQHCNLDWSNCTNAKQPLSSFVWYDELHPSERTGKWSHNTFFLRGGQRGLS